MSNILTAYSPPGDTPQELAERLFISSSGISLVAGSVVFNGSADAVSFFDTLDLGSAHLATGILLTTGDGTPGLTNTSSGYSIANGVLGDTQLTQIVQNAFPGAGSTEDASSLEFQVNAAPGIKSVIFDVVFGSDEFSEFSQTSFADIAAIFVNGKNAAFFAGDPKKPLSILDKNLKYFQDNENGSIAFEYDGISNKLTVIAKVHEGVNSIKLAIADTGDSIYDSGIAISNIRGSTKDLEGILNEIVGTAGADTLKADKGVDSILIGGLGNDKLFANTGFDILWGDEQVDDTAASPVDTAVLAVAVDAKDKFIFKSVKVLEKGVAKTDIIADFDKKDVIDVSKLSGATFDFIGKDGFSGNGDPEVRYVTKAKKDFTVVYGDADGNGGTDFTIKILGIHKLMAADFNL